MSHDRRPVSVEDLLRLKRAERPAPEFWSEFDRQLRAKQLAALVAKKPWWQGLPRNFSWLPRYQLSLGATAALAVTFFVLRDAPSSVPAVAMNDHRAAAASVPAATAAPLSVAGVERSALSDSVASPEVELVNAQPSAAAENADAAVVLVADVGRSAEFRSERISALEVLTGADVSSATVVTESPSARFIAANLAAAQASEPVGPNLLSGSQGFESRALPGRVAAVDPLQQMTPPGESRRSTRYLAAMVSTTLGETSPRTTERVANRISSEELYDQVHRFGARRGGFNVKF